MITVQVPSTPTKTKVCSGRPHKSIQNSHWHCTFTCGSSLTDSFCCFYSSYSSVCLWNCLYDTPCRINCQYSPQPIDCWKLRAEMTGKSQTIREKTKDCRLFQNTVAKRKSLSEESTNRHDSIGLRQYKRQSIPMHCDILLFIVRENFPKGICQSYLSAQNGNEK